MFPSNENMFPESVTMYPESENMHPESENMFSRAAPALATPHLHPSHGALRRGSSDLLPAFRKCSPTSHFRFFIAPNNQD